MQSTCTNCFKGSRVFRLLPSDVPARRVAWECEGPFNAACSFNFFFYSSFPFLFFLKVNRIFDGLYVLKKLRKFGYPPKVRRKFTYFGGLAHGRTKMALRRHLRFSCRRSPWTRFHPRARNLAGVCKVPSRTKKSLGDRGYHEAYGGHFVSKLAFSCFWGHFQGSYLNELLLGLSSDLFETWRVCS